MRTTVRLDERLLERARAEAVKRRTTLTSLIEQGLELVLRRPMKRAEHRPVTLPECRAAAVHCQVSTSMIVLRFWTGWTAAIDPSGRQCPDFRFSHGFRRPRPIQAMAGIRYQWAHRVRNSSTSARERRSYLHAPAGLCPSQLSNRRIRLLSSVAGAGQCGRYGARASTLVDFRGPLRQAEGNR